MKVRELIHALLDFDLDIPVYVAKDEEGNAFHPLSELSYGAIEEHEDEPVVVVWP